MSPAAMRWSVANRLLTMNLSEQIHPVEVFWQGDRPPHSSPSTYWYEGISPVTGERVSLPRTSEAEAIARELMRYLTGDRYTREGKMYGILLAETPTGAQVVLKAFSGLLNGEGQVAGWVLPLPGREQVAADEVRTLAALDTIRDQLLAAQQRPEPQQYAALMTQYDAKLQQLVQQHQQRKQTRQQQRQQVLETLTGAELAIALESLDEQSRRDGLDRRRLKRERDEAVRALRTQVDAITADIRQLKQERKRLSRQLQAQIHAAYHLLNFAGMAQPLPDLLPQGIPSGTGDCCAPKLLHAAAQRQFRPLAMAEFWWGKSEGDRQVGAFYGACAERCQPIMGFLLSGVPSLRDGAIAPNGSITSFDCPFEILHQDEDLIVVNKPTGLLSVPGRTGDRADSVLTRLQGFTQGKLPLFPVHRLDQDTSGVLLIATNLDVYRALQRQFQARQVHKVYEAILAGDVPDEQGTIELPLAAALGDRPRQRVDVQHGKPSLTQFRVLERRDGFTRVEFVPLTGRTHQLRVHAADPQGLGVPIWGDRLYGEPTSASRLHLHARELKIRHPHTDSAICLYAKTPF